MPYEEASMIFERRDRIAVIYNVTFLFIELLVAMLIGYYNHLK